MKAYFHKTPKKDRLLGDLYYTPKSLMFAARELIKEEFPKTSIILDPASGQDERKPIVESLRDMRYKVKECDLYDPLSGVDYTKEENASLFKQFYCITNPPFSLWDQFVHVAKSHAKKFMFIGRLNYLSTQGRCESGIWNHLKLICPFTRYVDYRTPYRTDGFFHVGGMATAWFLWDMSYSGQPRISEFINVRAWAKLGQYKKELYS